MANINKNGLTPNRQKFADEYLANGCNGKQAYLSAFSTKNEATAEANSSRLLKQKSVKSYIDKRLKEIQDKTQVKQEWVVMQLKEVVVRCMQQEPVMTFNKLTQCLEQDTVVNQEGEEVGAYTFDSMGANKALELLGKTLGIYLDKKELSGQVTAVSPLLESIANQLRWWYSCRVMKKPFLFQKSI